MAWRESRASLGRLGLFALSIACGVAALVATETVSANLVRRVREEARTLLAADLEVRSRKPLPADVVARVEGLSREGARVTRTVETMSMAASPETTVTRLVEVKAVGDGYPFYGTLTTEPASALEDFRAGRGVLVSPALLVQMGLASGATLRIGDWEARVAGVLTAEPDRVGDSFRIGPRVMMRHADVEKAGLIRKGSRATWRLLVGSPRAEAAPAWKARLATGLEGKDIEVRTAEEGQPALERFVTRVTTFLDLVGLSVLLLAGIGIGVAIHTFIAQRLDTLAVLKCLGATQAQVLAVYLIQTVALAVAGSIAGAVLGVAMPMALPGLLAGVLPFPVTMELVPVAVARGVALGVLLSTAFALPPLLAMRRVQPLAIFARAVSGRGKRDPLAMLSLATLACACAALAAWRAGGAELAAVFLGGFVVAVAAVGLAARAVLWLARRIARLFGFTTRHAIGGLARPGNQTSSVTIALGLGVFLVALVHRVDVVLRSEFADGVSATAPNLFVVDLQDDQLAGFREVLDRHRVKPLEVAALVRSRITALADRPITELYPDPEKAPWWINREYTLTFRDGPGDAERLERGRFWEPGSKNLEASLEKSTAERLKLDLGDWFTLDVQGTELRVKVTSIRTVRWSSMRPNFFMILPPKLLEDAPRSWFAVAHVPGAEARAGIQRDLVRRFNNLMILDISQGLSVVRLFVERLGWVIGMAALFCVAGGVLVMAASVVMTRRHRMRELAILKAQGATSGQLMYMLAVEYGLLGGVAGFVGSLAAAGVARALAVRLFDARVEFLVVPVLIATGTTALVTGATGALASRGMLRRPALEILRED